MFTRLAALAAITLFALPAFADESPPAACQKVDDVKTQIEPAIGNTEMTVVSLTDADAVKALVAVIEAHYGKPPVDDSTFASIVVFEPIDHDQYNDYIGFFGADGCKLIGLHADHAQVEQLIVEARQGGKPTSFYGAPALLPNGNRAI